MAKKQTKKPTKPVKQRDSWYKPNQLCHLHLEMYSQIVFGINLYGFENENIVYDNIKEYFRRHLFDESQMEQMFTPTQERYIKDVLKAGIEEQNCGFMFRFSEFDEVACVVVNPTVKNPTLDPIIINQYLIHEIVHCALRVLDCCGIKMPHTLNEAEDEQICLLIDYIYKKIAHAFMIPKKSS